MKIIPQQSGARHLVVNSAYLTCDVLIDACASGDVRIIDAAGHEVGRGRLEVITPQVLRPNVDMDSKKKNKLESRRSICNTCSESNGTTRYTVKCKNCGCAGLSLLNGVCKLEKW